MRRSQLVEAWVDSEEIGSAVWQGGSTPPSLPIMDNYTAIGLAEGFIEADSEEQILEAWQYLHDTGLAYELQGWFGRMARNFIEQGLIIDK